jgi:hypothetical protein
MRVFGDTRLVRVPPPLSTADKVDILTDRLTTLEYVVFGFLGLLIMVWLLVRR